MSENSYTKKQNILGVSLLLIATLLWGTSFLILKQTIATTPPIFVIALRFLSVGLIISLIFIKRLIHASKSTFIFGIILGVTTGGAYIFQTLGLSLTSPSQNAFLTASYCVMVPFLMWLICKKRPKIYNVVAVVLCTAGIGLIALSGKDVGGGSNLFLGDALTLVSAIFFALQIVFIYMAHEKGNDGLSLLAIQLVVTGITCGIYTAAVEIPTYGISAFALSGEALLKIGYLALFATLITNFCQIYGQRFSSPTQVALILPLESVFGAIFSVLFGGEVLSVLMIIGFAVVFFAITYNESYSGIKSAIISRRKNLSDTTPITAPENCDSATKAENLDNSGSPKNTESIE